MKMFYVPKTPFGEFFYDPVSHWGVGISEDGPIIVGMDTDYDPRMHPGYKECDIDDGVFSSLTDAIGRYNAAYSEIGDILNQFPRVKTISSPADVVPHSD